MKVEKNTHGKILELLTDVKLLFGCKNLQLLLLGSPRLLGVPLMEYVILKIIGVTIANLQIPN